MSDFQRLRGDRVAVKADVVYIGRWMTMQMNQGKSFWSYDILV